WTEPAANIPSTKMANAICAVLFNIVVLPLSFTSFGAAVGLPSVSWVPTAGRSPTSRRNFAVPGGDGRLTELLWIRTVSPRGRECADEIGGRGGRIRPALERLAQLARGFRVPTGAEERPSVVQSGARVVGRQLDRPRVVAERL